MHLYLLVDTSTERHTSSPPLTLPVSTLKSWWPPRDVKDSASRASAEPAKTFEVLLSIAFSILGQNASHWRKLIILQALKRFAKGFPVFLVEVSMLSISKMDGCCRHKCFTENSIPSWTLPFHCVGMVRSHLNLKVSVVPVLINSILCYRYVYQNSATNTAFGTFAATGETERPFDRI